MTSMQKILNKEISLDRVKKSIIKNFGVIFKKRLEERCLKEII
jgi:hypothetical protein